MQLSVSKKDFSSMSGGSPGLNQGPVPFPEFVVVTLAGRGGSAVTN